MSRKAIDYMCCHLSDLQAHSSDRSAYCSIAPEFDSCNGIPQIFLSTEKSQEIANISIQAPGLLNHYSKELLDLYTHKIMPSSRNQDIFPINAGSWPFFFENSLKKINCFTSPSLEKNYKKQQSESKMDSKQKQDGLLKKVMFLNRIYNLEILSLVNNPKTLEKASFEIFPKEPEAKKHEKLEKKNIELMRKNALMRDILDQIRNKVLETNIIYSHFQYDILDEETCLQHPNTFEGKLPAQFYDTYKKERGFRIQDLKTLSEEQYDIPTVWKGPLLIVADMEAKYNMVERRYQTINEKYKNLRKSFDALTRENDDLWKRMKDMDVKASQRKRTYEDNLQLLMNNYELKIKNILEMIRQNSMNSDINLLKEEITRAGQLVDQKNTCILRLSQRISKIDTAKKELEAQNNEMREYIERIQAGPSPIQENEEQIENAQREQLEKSLAKISYFEKYTRYLEDENIKVKNLRLELDQTKKSLAHSEHKISKLQQENQRLINQINTLESVNQELKQQIHKNEGKQQATYNSYLQENNRKVGMSIQLDKKDQQMPEEDLREEYKQALEKNKALQRNLSDLHFQFEKLRGCIEKFKEERFNLVTNNRQLRNVLKQYQIKETKNRYHSSDPKYP